MKNTSIILAIIILTSNLVLPLTTKSQDITVPEPEFVNTVVFVKDDQSSEQLEKQFPFSKNRESVGGYVTRLAASYHTTLEVKGNVSPVRLPFGENLRFIIHVVDNSVDPSTFIKVMKMDVTSKTRRIEVAKTNVLGTSKSGEISTITFNAEKYGQNSYLITINQSLYAGEYAIMLQVSNQSGNIGNQMMTQNNTMYLFGIN